MQQTVGNFPIISMSFSIQAQCTLSASATRTRFSDSLMFAAIVCCLYRNSRLWSMQVSLVTSSWTVHPRYVC